MPNQENGKFLYTIKSDCHYLDECIWKLNFIKENILWINMNISPVNIIHILIVWQSLLFAVVLATPAYNKNKSNLFLSLLLLTLAVHFSYNLLYSNGLYVDVLPQYSCSYGFLYGPLFFLYIKFHLEKNAAMKPRQWLHFVPFFTILIVTAAGFKICKWASLLIFPTMLTYAILSFRELALYAQTIVHVSSKNVDSETKWLKTLSVFMLAIVLVDIFSARVQSIPIFNTQLQTEVVVQVVILCFVSLINYQGLRNPLPFQQISESDIELSKASNAKAPLAKIDVQILQDLVARLDQYMLECQPYLDADLSINAVAASMGVSEKNLSQSINTIVGANFSDYINTYRIEYVRKKLDDDTARSMSIKEVMYESGFNSRSVFNTAFKKKTGFTPSEYQKRHQ
jgi:AraC-like DNA-binding protein